MLERIRDFFYRNGIEYFSPVSYSDCCEISPDISARIGFTPRSVLVYLIPYYVAKPENLSVYAASLDYHLFIRELSEKAVEFFKSLFPNNNFYGYGDHSPIDERGAALIGGLGILGDSGMLINEKYGTYVFIADIVTDIFPEELSAVKHPVGYCSHCGKCRAACPTGILRNEGGDCLSAITQRKGELSEDELVLMKKYNTVWGCDLCQAACPYNADPLQTPIEFFFKDRIELLTSDGLAALSRDELKKRAFGWRGRATVERNLKGLGF